MRRGELWRLFVAAPIPPAVKHLIADAQETLASRSLPYRWVDPSLTHITLKFLGDSNPRRLRELAQRFDWVAGRSEPMALSTAGVGAFPNSRRPRVIWLGLDGQTLELARLAGDVDEVAVEFGYEAERRRFRPHITIGRLKRGYEPSEDFELAVRELTLQRQDLQVDRIQLFRSLLGPDGPSYAVVDEWRLGQTARTPRALNDT